MGTLLPKPVMTGVLDRNGNSQFKIGSASVMGYRENMEDSHIAFLQDQWGFFGVFDGHCNDECSAYLEREWTRRLSEWSDPLPTEQIANVCLEIDRQFCATGSSGGSTGTFFFATRNKQQINLVVGNVGDSRVLACKRGKLVELTTDHKPDLPEERNRIYRCGGSVENGRVNGALAVSRAFGDKEYKSSSGGGQLDQPVIALPDITEVELRFNSGDFAVLACDGVFEENFSNGEVIHFVSKRLKRCDDLAAIAHDVTKEAVQRGSKDNISCMIVLFTDGSGDERVGKELIPGPLNAIEHAGFRKAYGDMAQRGDVKIGRVLELRYDALQTHTAFQLDEESDELPQIFGNGPPQELTGDDRTLWFEELWFHLERLHHLPSFGGFNSDNPTSIDDDDSNGIPLFGQHPFQLDDLMKVLKRNIEERKSK